MNNNTKVGISGIENNLGPVKGSLNNGIISDIYMHNDNLDHVMVNNDIKLSDNKSIGCGEDILSGVLEETLLSKYFFSDDNIKNLQKLIRYEFWNEKKVAIDNQSNIILLTIMRGIFLKYSNSGDRTLEKIKLQIQKLNNMVVQYSLEKIYSNYEMYKHYLDQTSRLPDVMPLPQSNNSRPNTTYDLSERNDMSGAERRYFDVFS